jgi:AcrR family transcriptional regulator
MEERHGPRAGAPTGEEVLAAAERLLEDQGPGGLSVRRVAELVGTSRQVVYSRFGGKAGLLRALHDRGFADLTAEVRAVDAAAGGDDHVVGLARAYRRAALRLPVRFEVMFGRPFREFDHDDASRRVAEASFDQVVEGARAWLEANGGRSSEARSLAATLWALTHGVVALERVGHLTGRQAEHHLDVGIRRVLHGAHRQRSGGDGGDGGDGRDMT